MPTGKAAHPGPTGTTEPAEIDSEDRSPGSAAQSVSSVVRPTDDTEAGIDEASRVLPVTTPSASGSPEDALDPDEAPPSEGPAFPVVGIGASSGGVEALELFFGAVPPNSGIAFIVVQHLDPTHESILAEIVARHAPMPVLQVEDGVVVEPNHVYVIPPNRDMRAGSRTASANRACTAARSPAAHRLTFSALWPATLPSGRSV